MLRLKATIQLHFRADEAKREERAKVDAIRTRATHAREAIACANRADRCEAQLLALKQDYASRLDLQLGLLLVQRGITLAHIAANWPKPRGTHNKDHVHDVSKEEFKDRGPGARAAGRGLSGGRRRQGWRTRILARGRQQPRWCRP